jgi:porphobilinogen deaminase
MSIAEMVPAPGQGCLAVQARADDLATIEAVARLDHSPSHDALMAERLLMRSLGGGCALPLAALAERAAAGMRMTAIALTPTPSYGAPGRGERHEVAELAFDRRGGADISGTVRL